MSSITTKGRAQAMPSVWRFGTPIMGLFLLFLLLNQQGSAENKNERLLPSMDKFAETAVIVRDKCMVCHSRDYELPFYAGLPGIKSIVERNYNDGYRAMDLNEEFSVNALDRPVNEVTLAKMEWVTVNDTMPPAKFAAVHWQKRLSSEESSTILHWVSQTRAKYYTAVDVAQKWSQEPVQPLPAVLETDPAKVALGKKLFNSVQFSVNDSVSCASCHALDKGGADGKQFSEGVHKQLGDANSPSVYNAVFNIRQFWDGRAADLREQAAAPPFNPKEMGSKDWDQIIAKLCQDKQLVEEFLKVYPYAWTGDSGGWSGYNISDAIAEYEKTLITPGSRFDRWLKGDGKAISPLEFEGYQRFKAYRCSSCHVGKTLGGQSFEYMDLKKDYFKDRGGSFPSDPGLKAFTSRESDLHKFKVPNLRNVELTAPYLHDGTVPDLNEAVQIMGIYLVGMEVLPQDEEAIVAFLRTLTGEFEGRPLGGGS